jgi:hypothetical protein
VHRAGLRTPHAMGRGPLLGPLLPLSRHRRLTLTRDGHAGRSAVADRARQRDPPSTWPRRCPAAPAQRALRHSPLIGLRAERSPSPNRYAARSSASNPTWATACDPPPPPPPDRGVAVHRASPAGEGLATSAGRLQVRASNCRDAIGLPPVRVLSRRPVHHHRLFSSVCQCYLTFVIGKSNKKQQRPDQRPRTR